MKRTKLSIPLAAVLALLTLVIGVVAGRATSGATGSSGGGAGGAAAGKRVDVIIKASDSAFWQTMLAGANKAADDYGFQVATFGPTSETDVAQQVQLVENSISRGVDAVVLTPNSSTALNGAIDRARAAKIKVVIVDTKVTTESDGFIGTDNEKAAESAGKQLCDQLKKQNKASGGLLIEASVAGVETITSRENGFKQGLAAGCPSLRVIGPRYNNNDVNLATSQVNDVLTAERDLVAVFAANNASGVGAARAIKDNNAVDRIPVTSFDTDAQEVAGLKDGSLDTLVVQNPYFFGYQGVVEAGMAAVGTAPPFNLDPGAVLADQSNMDKAEVKALLNPPTAQAGK